MNNFTPGPWKADTCTESNQRDIFPTNGGPTVGRVYVDTPEGEANARAVAELPNLLASLEAVKNQLSYLFHNGQIRANAPERQRIQRMIVHAEYIIEKATAADDEGPVAL